MSLGERIRERRQALGITQEELAQVLRVTPQHISAVEKDKRVPSLAFVARLAEELAVSIDYLVSGVVGGKEGIITGIVPAIKADKRLKPKVKRAMITLVGELRRPAISEETSEPV
jgi:transcriptional regulator with XRE-family HTH domain